MRKFSMSFRKKRLVGAQKVGVPLQFGYERKMFWQWVVVAALAVVVVVGGIYMTYKRYLIVKTVDVQQISVAKPDVVPLASLKQVANQALGQPMLSFNEQAYSAHLLKLFPSLSALRVERRYPQTLAVTFEPRIAICILKTDYGSFLVDRNGVLFAHTPQDMAGVHLPTLTTSSSQARSLGQTVSVEGVVLGIGLAKNLHVTSPQLQEMVLHDGQLDVHFSGPPEVYIADQKAPEAAAQTLQVLFDTFAKDNRYPNIVDLRYDRPVLRY